MDNQRINYLIDYQHDIDFDLEDGHGPILRRVRQKISEQTLTPLEETWRDSLDETVIIAVIKLGDDLADYLIEDDSSQPLINWWWHLGKICNKTYPFELLPPHLQAVYAEIGNNS